MTPRLKEKYTAEVAPALMKQFAYKSAMQVPRLEKIVLNVALGAAVTNVKLLDSVQRELTAVAGQKAVITKARKAIATFKIRVGMPIGCMVTLRGDRMYQFMDKFISVALPRIRDFRGISDKSFDGRGNYAIGIKEQFLFPEISYDKVEIVHGMDIAICTSAPTDEEGRALLKELGMPFRN
jgi:large subunit ribosomal protein L5